MCKKSILNMISGAVKPETGFKDEVYHKSKLLLRIYRDVIWRTQEIMSDTDLQAHDFGSRRIREFADYLSFDFESGIDKQKAEERLMNLEETKLLIGLVDKSLLKLKAYPEHGELYFIILTNQYIYANKQTDAEMIETLEIERTQYYRRKKKAIHLFGIVLWGYMLPQVYRYLKETDVQMHITDFPEYSEQKANYLCT